MGYQNTLYAYVARGDGVVVMTNADAGAELAQELIRAVAAEYRWPSYQPVMRKAIALPAATRAKLAGRYEIKDLGGFEIAEREGKLMIALRENAQRAGVEQLRQAPRQPCPQFRQAGDARIDIGQLALQRSAQFKAGARRFRQQRHAGVDLGQISALNTALGRAHALTYQR